MFYKLTRQAYTRMRLYDNGKRQMSDEQLIAYINSQFKLKFEVTGLIIEN
jgi:hypothetical protein